jgi:[acyl-carrier-protein] S-malonyltransferase
MSTNARCALVFPGRGSYSERTLRSIPPEHPLLARAEALRAERGLEPLAALDRAERFSAARHLAPANAAALIYLVSMIDAEPLLESGRCVAIVGNSMGWYTALAAAGVLSFEDGFRLVQEMALLQHDEQQRAGGGQLLYPLVDDQWRPDAERARLVREAVDALPGEAFHSIHLGGSAVLAGTDRGIAQLQARLPATKLGSTSYPLRLAQHGAYHTPLLSGLAQRARELLGGADGLRFARPACALIDGLGRRHAPWSADLDELRAYTLGAQIDAPYDFALSVRVLLREWAPDRLVLPGPGNTLGSICAQILIAEGWRGLHTRADFEALQASERPLLDSLRR